MTVPDTTPIRTENLQAGYGGRAVVHDISMRVEAGHVLAILGPNGAGKTTLLSTLAGALAPVGGEVFVNGRRGARRQHRRARQGIGYVAEEKSVFMDLTVTENLRISDGDPRHAFDLFPELDDHRRRKAGLLSGGQQQILTLARALSTRPSVLLADELSLGLAPMIVTRLLAAIRAAADDGLAVILVEQHARQALAVSDHALALRRGHVAMSGTASEISDRFDDLAASYLASSSGAA